MQVRFTNQAVGENTRRLLPLLGAACSQGSRGIEPSATVSLTRMRLLRLYARRAELTRYTSPDPAHTKEAPRTFRMRRCLRRMGSVCYPVGIPGAPRQRHRFLYAGGAVKRLLIRLVSTHAFFANVNSRVGLHAASSTENRPVRTPENDAAVLLPHTSRCPI